MVVIGLDGKGGLGGLGTGRVALLMGCANFFIGLESSDFLGMSLRKFCVRFCFYAEMLCLSGRCK